MPLRIAGSFPISMRRTELKQGTSTQTLFHGRLKTRLNIYLETCHFYFVSQLVVCSPEYYRKLPILAKYSHAYREFCFLQIRNLFITDACHAQKITQKILLIKGSNVL